MKKIFVLLVIVHCSLFIAYAQKDATVKEYMKTFTTYPFSDPNPIPDFSKYYPYFRYDGFTDKPIQKDWKIVELENDYIKVMITPEIGGKIWAAMYKTQVSSIKNQDNKNKSAIQNPQSEIPFIYYNHVVKFRDIAQRGPWTSGGIEANYGVIGHTANVSTPVDYTYFTNPDGSASCLIGSFDMITQTYWRIEINLPKDKAYFTTNSYWYNKNEYEIPYYHWMNVGIKSSGDLELIFPGNKYIGHDGKAHDWPFAKCEIFTMENGKKVSHLTEHNLAFYEQNNFGSYKSYHVLGTEDDFFGAYWHKDGYGMARYSLRSDKAGKKAWIWGLSRQGMIWEKLLTDNDGQYVEVQSGRLFNQAIESSTQTPFKHMSMAPYQTDTWKEYWYPVIGTDGFVQANEYGALNVKYNNGWLKISFCPVQNISDTLKVSYNFSKVSSFGKVVLTPLHTFIDSIKIDSKPENLIITLGRNKLIYNSNPDSDNLNRPIESPSDFDWKNTYGLYLAGKEFMDHRMYTEAEVKFKECLKSDKYYFPALNKIAQLFYRETKYDSALIYAKTALSINTYDGESNYYYGLINTKLGNIDAKDGFDIATMSNEYRSPAYYQLSKMYFLEKNLVKSIEYANKALENNPNNIDALKILALIYRDKNDKANAEKILNQILSFDKLCYFVYFEKYLWDPSEANKAKINLIKNNELSDEIFLDLAGDYYNLGFRNGCKEVLYFIDYNSLAVSWLLYLGYETIHKYKYNKSAHEHEYPYKSEFNEIFKKLIIENKYPFLNYFYKYNLALLFNYENRMNEAKEFLNEIGEQSGDSEFYVVRANLITESAEKDLKKAMELDKKQWRYPKMLTDYYLKNKEYIKALEVSEAAYKMISSQFSNYNSQFSIIGLQYVKCLMLNKKYEKADKILTGLNVLPYEGAGEGHEIYREIKLMKAISALQKKNNKLALKYINEAKGYPENLGVGKPYDSEIDYRLENWMEKYAKEDFQNLKDLENLKTNDSNKRIIEELLKVK